MEDSEDELLAPELMMWNNTTSAVAYIANNLARHGQLGPLMALWGTGVIKQSFSAVAAFAVKNGHIQVVQWAMEAGCPVAPNLYDLAVAGGHTDIALWLSRHSHQPVRPTPSPREYVPPRQYGVPCFDSYYIEVGDDTPSAALGKAEADWSYVEVEAPWVADPDESDGSYVNVSDDSEGDSVDDSYVYLTEIPWAQHGL